jgi:hypothetical protein
MASVKIIMTTGTNEDPPIVVDEHVVKVKKDYKIKFVNKLDGGPDAFITFHPMNDKGGAIIEDFCMKKNGDVIEGEQLKVPASGKACFPTTTGEFAYTVKAADHQDLDPVLIIEPQFQQYLTVPPIYETPAFNPVVAIITLLAGAVAGYMLRGKMG